MQIGERKASLPFGHPFGYAQLGRPLRPLLSSLSPSLSPPPPPKGERNAPLLATPARLALYLSERRKAVGARPKLERALIN